MTEDFITRHRYERHLPPRDLVERDSPRLRGLIWNIASRGGRTNKVGYQNVCRVVGQLPDPNVWSDNASAEAAVALIDELSWTDVYEALEKLYADAPSGSGAAPSASGAFSKHRVEAAANDALARSGLAYEMRAGRFELYDPEAERLEVRGTERDALAVLTDEFAPVRVQYLKALEKLHGRPADQEGAVADAVNALEAVAVIVSGRNGGTLGNVAKALFPDGEGHHQPLRDAIVKLYGYSSAVPGVRHGRYAEPVIAMAETAMVVRIVGAIITFLITDHRS